MPHLTQLRVSNFRNLGAVDIQPSPEINLIYGQNGAGKSSLLEAINVASIGRSFRTRKFKQLIQLEAPGFTVFSRIQQDSASHVLDVIGIERKSNGQSRFKLNSKNIHSAAELAATLPSLVINAQSFSLLEGAAKERRMFFDWLVFHVKHDFPTLWRDYSKCLKQRNSLLRRDKIPYGDLDAWDKELVRLAERIKADRQQTFEAFNQGFCSLFQTLKLGEHKVSLEYFHGWKEESALEDQLRADFERDKKYGFTHAGPHKAELRIKIGKTPAVDILSRGQQKLLISGLLINEAQVFREKVDKYPVLLIDDMPAELDGDYLTILKDWVLGMKVQAFVTGIDRATIESIWCSDSSTEKNNIAVFHVKHGEVLQE